MELHPFIYSQGKSAGQAGINDSINVRDWQFTLSNRQDNNAGSAPADNGYANDGFSRIPENQMGQLPFR